MHSFSMLYLFPDADTHALDLQITPSVVSTIFAHVMINFGRFKKSRGIHIQAKNEGVMNSYEIGKNIQTVWQKCSTKAIKENR